MIDSMETGSLREESLGAKKKSVWKQPSTWVRFLLGGIFIFASVDKILHPAEFAKIVFNYQILPGVLINVTAIVLPWLELLLGILLVLGLWLPGALVLCNLLLVSFYSVLIFNTARGLNVHCGCFSTSTAGDPNTLWYFIRDGSFLLMAVYLSYCIFYRNRVT